MLERHVRMLERIRSLGADQVAPASRGTGQARGQARERLTARRLGADTEFRGGRGKGAREATVQANCKRL